MARKKSNYYTKRLKSLLSLYKHDNLCVVSRLTTSLYPSHYHRTIYLEVSTLNEKKNNKHVV